MSKAKKKGKKASAPVEIDNRALE